MKHLVLSLLCLLFTFCLMGQQKPIPAKTVDAWKKAVITSVDSRAKDVQVMVDMVFSFAELGFQETETSAYLTGILEKNGFTIERGIAGIPTA